MFQEYMEKLVESVTTKEFSEEVIKAKKEYFSKVGEIFEDDKYFENRMVSFTEWYCFDRISEQYQKSPLEHFIDTNMPIWSKQKLDIYTEFLKNIHSVFYVNKIKKDEVVIQDMSDSKKFTISMNQSNLIFHKKDIFEARLIPFKEEYYFSGSFCFHPNQIYRKIKKKLKEKSNNQTEKMKFLFLLSSMSLKLERSRNINYKDIYKI